MLTIEQMALSAAARAAAEALRAAHPNVVFTSGRRDVAGQARAMASNVIHNRRWIEQTYADSIQRGLLQAWLDANPHTVAQDAIAWGLHGLMRTWTDAELSHFSKHLSGAAFDVAPVAGAAGAAIKATIRALPGLTRFLEEEGGLIRWHAEFA